MVSPFLEICVVVFDKEQMFDFFMQLDYTMTTMKSQQKERLFENLINYRDTSLILWFCKKSNRFCAKGQSVEKRALDLCNLHKSFAPKREKILFPPLGKGKKTADLSAFFHQMRPIRKRYTKKCRKSACFSVVLEKQTEKISTPRDPAGKFEFSLPFFSLHIIMVDYYDAS